MPTVAYSGDPGAGNSQRWGDTLDVRGAGTNTQVIIGARNANLAALLTTTDGGSFTSKLITVSDAPAGAFGLGIAFGAGATFWGKATSQNLRQVSFDLAAGTGATVRSHADPEFPRTVAPIGVSTELNLLGGINVGATGNNLRLYDLTPANGTPVFITSTNFATDNDNTYAGTGAVDFGNDHVYALSSNNGLIALQIIPPEDQTPPVISLQVRLAPERRVELQVSGSPGHYAIAVATTSNLLNWVDLTNFAITNDAFQCLDPRDEPEPAVLPGAPAALAAEGHRECLRGVLNSVRSSPRPKPEARRPKEGRNPNCRIRSHRRGATDHWIKSFSDFGSRPSFGLRPSGFGFQGCDSTLEQPCECPLAGPLRLTP